jgi:hypothetical protein
LASLERYSVMHVLELVTVISAPLLRRAASFFVSTAFDRVRRKAAVEAQPGWTVPVHAVDIVDLWTMNLPCWVATRDGEIHSVWSVAERIAFADVVRDHVPFHEEHWPTEKEEVVENQRPAVVASCGKASSSEEKEEVLY